MSEPLIEIDVGFGKVVGRIGYIPAAFAGAVAELNNDLVSHHRQSVMKNHGLAKGHRARRFVASRLHGYGRRKPNPTHIEDATGETFLAAGSGELAGEDSIRRLEFGGTVTTSKAMAIPIGRGRPYKGAFKNVAIWNRTKLGLGGGEFAVVPNPNGGPSLIVDERERTVRRLRDEADRVVGLMVRRRQQRPLLGFRREFDRIWPRHSAKYDKAAEMAATAAGRAALADRTETLQTVRAAGSRAFSQFIESNPGDYKGARKASAEAKRIARRSRMG